MTRNLINLLPPPRIRSFRRAYFYRLATVALMLLVAVILIHTVLLFPSYLFLNAQIEGREVEAARLDAELNGSAGQEANTELALLEAKAVYLARLSSVPAASAAVRSVLATPRQGISLTGMTYTPPVGDAGNGKMSLTGNASTRESLRAYATALRTIPGVASVDLPISAYATESDIPFTLTVTGTFTP